MFGQLLGTTTRKQPIQFPLQKLLRSDGNHISEHAFRSEIYLVKPPLNIILLTLYYILITLCT